MSTHPHHSCTAVRPSFPGHFAHFIPFTHVPHPLVHPTLTTAPIHIPLPTGHPGSPQALCPCPHAALHTPCLHKHVLMNHQRPPRIPAMVSPCVTAPYQCVPTHVSTPPLYMAKQSSPPLSYHVGTWSRYSTCAHLLQRHQIHDGSGSAPHLHNTSYRQLRHSKE